MVPERFENVPVPVQAKFPFEFVTVQPVELEPPPSKIFPVEVAPILTVPVLFASIVKFSSVPEEIVERASPPPAAAAVTLSPVALDAVFVST